MGLYYVIQFSKDNTVEVAPASWLFDNNNQCNWPHEITDKVKLNNLIKKGNHPSENPKISWKIFQCNVLLGTDDLHIARTGAKKASEALEDSRSEFDLTDAEVGNTDGGRVLRKQAHRSNYKIYKNTVVFDEEIQIDDTSDTNTKDHDEPQLIPNVFQDLASTDTPVHEPEHMLRVSSNNLDQGDQQYASEIFARLDKLTLDIQQFRSELQNFEVVTIEKLVKVSNELDHVSRTLGRHLVSSLHDDELDLPVGISFPLQDGRKLATLHLWLESNDKQIKLANYLKGIGGSDLKDCIKRILERLISPELGRAMNFSGSNAKIAFKNHHLRPCLIAALRTSQSSIPTEVEVDKYVQKWFGNSGDRNGGRKARRQLASNQQSASAPEVSE